MSMLFRPKRGVGDDPRIAHIETHLVALSSLVNGLALLGAAGGSGPAAPELSPAVFGQIPEADVIFDPGGGHDHDGVDSRRVDHANLTNVLPDQHHAQHHAINGPDHTLAGATAGQVLTALSPTTFAFQPPAGVAGVGMGIFNPKDFGAIGDAASHLITAGDIAAHPGWLGTYVVGDEWDYVGCQEAIFAAFGAPFTNSTGLVCCGHGYANRRLNGSVYIPGGWYRINRTLVLRNVIGATLTGAGRLSATLHGTVAERPVLETNMVYSSIANLAFFADARLTGKAIVEWTWDGSADSTASGLQQLSIYDCMFHGQSVADYGFRVARDLYQGDNIVFHNAKIDANLVAGFTTGQSAYNALNLCFYTCNLAQNLNHGIEAFGGNVVVVGGSFQTPNLKRVGGQVGFDIHIVGSGNCHSVVYGTRSESARFVHADSGQNMDIRGCFLIGGPVDWVANHAYVVGDYVKGTITPALHSDGYPYICTTAGNSGATEPVWDGSLALADGGVVWQRYDFNAVEMDSGCIDDCTIPWGRIKLGTTCPITIRNSIFSRKDWLLGPSANEALSDAAQMWTIDGVRVCPGGGINQSAPIPYSLPSVVPNTHPTVLSQYLRPGINPLLFSRPDADAPNRAAIDVGLWPPPGRQPGGADALARNVLGVQGAVSPRPAAGANAPGTDLCVQGGLGTGSAAGGAIRLRAGAPAGAGSQINSPSTTRDALRIDYARLAAGVLTQFQRMTQAARDALSPPPNVGDQIYNLTLQRVQVWNGFVWDDLSPGTMTWTFASLGAALNGWWSLNDPATLWQATGGTTPANAAGQPIARIDDKTAGAHPYLLPGATTAPLYTAGVAAQGRPVVSFDGVTGRLATALYSRPAPNTVIFIGRLKPGFPGTQTAWSAANVTLAAEVQITPTYVLFYNGGSIQGFTDTTKLFCLICTYDGSNSVMWLNGTKLLGPGLAAGATLQGISLGALYSGTVPSGLEMCEMGNLDRALTDAEALQILAYAMGWGVEAALP